MFSWLSKIFKKTESVKAAPVLTQTIVQQNNKTIKLASIPISEIVDHNESILTASWSGGQPSLSNEAIQIPIPAINKGLIDGEVKITVASLRRQLPGTIRDEAVGNLIIPNDVIKKYIDISDLSHEARTSIDKPIVKAKTSVNTTKDIPPAMKVDFGLKKKETTIPAPKIEKPAPLVAPAQSIAAKITTPQIKMEKVKPISMGSGNNTIALSKVAVKWTGEAKKWADANPNAIVNLPAEAIELALQKGKLLFAIREVANWSGLKTNVEVEVVLPLALIAPMFIKGIGELKKSETSTDIPDVFAKRGGTKTAQGAPGSALEKLCVNENIEAAVFALNEGLVVAANGTSKYASDSLAAFVPGLVKALEKSAASMGINIEETTLHENNRDIKIMKINELYLVVIGKENCRLQLLKGEVEI